MALDIVEEPTVDINEPSESKATNPITDPQVEEPEIKEEPSKPESPKEDGVEKAVQKRIDKAIARQKEAENRASDLEKRLAALEQRSTSPKEVDDKEPTLDKFDSFDEYVAAKAEWVAAKKIDTVLSEREQREKEERAARERQTTLDSWNKRVKDATVEIPDFEEVLADSDVPMTPVMQDAIMDSDIGPKLAYFLATNPDEAMRIASLSPIAAIRAIGRIEEKLVTPVAKKTTSAPPPITPVGGKASVKKDPGQMSDEEYAKWRKSAKV